MSDQNPPLYHGSTIPGITELRPTAHTLVGDEPSVFATPDIRFALAMIHGTDTDLSIGYITDLSTGKEEMYIEEQYPDAFKVLKAPGILYSIDPTDFKADTRLTRVELLSNKPAAVLSERAIDDVLSELRRHDIRLIEFKDKEHATITTHE